MIEKTSILSHIGQKPLLSRLVKESLRRLINRQEFVVLALLLAALVFLSLWTDTFFTANNLSNVTRAFSWIAIVAFGEAIVIIIGGIDLSVGAIVALTGLVTA